MAVSVVKIDEHTGCAEAVRKAAELLEEGGLVAFPTETVYGVAARADSVDAVDRLRAVKARPVEQAFTVHIGAREDAERFVPELGCLGRRFIRKGWPGPLTLLFPVEEPGKAAVMAGHNGAVAANMYYEGTIGLRCPDDPVASGMLRAVRAPVVAASANSAGCVAPLTGDEVLRALGDRIDLLIDAGQTRYAKRSTIVRVNDRSYELVREGVLDARIVERLSTLRFLFVCTGNTCRSPMAAGLAAKMISQRLNCGERQLPERGIMVESAGTAGGFGAAAKHAVSVVAQRGIDLSGHASSALVVEMVHHADHILVMTRSHYEMVVRMDSSARDRVQMLLDDEDIKDPIGGTEADYEACAGSIERGLAKRLQEVSL